MDYNRITKMESALNEITKAIKDLQDQLDRLKLSRENAVALYSYYGSEDWHKDREEELPEGIKAGVLSEDAVYDSITELRELAFNMIELGTDVLKNWI